MIDPETSGGERKRKEEVISVGEEGRAERGERRIERKQERKRGKRKQKEREKKKGAEQKERCEGSSERLFSKSYSPQLCFQFINTVNWMEDDITK